MILAVLQARMSSTRLPGKILKAICDQPMIVLQIERILRSKNIDKLIVATSDAADDDAVFDICEAHGFICRRGPLDDVLGRFQVAIEGETPAHIVRLTADCPLIDPGVIDGLIALHRDTSDDYTSNSLRRSFPHGLDCEVFTRSAVSKAFDGTTSDYDKEHVTPYLYRPGNGFKVGQLTMKRDLSFLRWTVDYPEDFELIDGIYEGLYRENRNFGTADVIRFLAKFREFRAVNEKWLTDEQKRQSKEFWAEIERDGSALDAWLELVPAMLTEFGTE